MNTFDILIAKAVSYTHLKKVTVEASAFSASAKEAIEAAGGKAEVK